MSYKYGDVFKGINWALQYSSSSFLRQRGFLSELVRSPEISGVVSLFFIKPQSEFLGKNLGARS